MVFRISICMQSGLSITHHSYYQVYDNLRSHLVILILLYQFYFEGFTLYP